MTVTSGHRRALIISSAALLLGCGRISYRSIVVHVDSSASEGDANQSDAAADASVEASTDGGIDPQSDAAADVGMDARAPIEASADITAEPWLDSDSSADAGAPDNGSPDAGPMDAVSPDAEPPDAGLADAPSPDAGAIDSGPPPAAPTLRFPWNGYTTPSGTSRLLMVVESYSDGNYVEVEFNDSCDPFAFESCDFAASAPYHNGSFMGTRFVWPPLVPRRGSAPEGKRLYWHARVCRNSSNCGPWSEIRYFTAFGDPHDLNGDAYSDLVIGAPGIVAGSGVGSHVYVFHGGAGGLPTSPTITLDDPNPATGWEDYFAYPAGVGDVDFDGFNDLAIRDITSPMQGNVHLFYGSASGVSFARSRRIDRPGSFGLEFGNPGGAGDVDENGLPDLLIGFPRQNDVASQAGAAYVYQSTVGSTYSAPTHTLYPPNGGADTFFGSVVAGIGDIDGDGRVEVAIAQGASRVGMSDPTLFIYGFPFASVRTSHFVSSAVTSITGGDFNGDGFADVALGQLSASNPEAGEGIVTVLYGSGSGFASTTVLETNIATSGLGVSVAAADLDGDGCDELLAGQHYARRVLIFDGGPSGLSTSWRALPAPASTVTTGDYNGDGRVDVATGDGDDSSAMPGVGRANVYYNSPTGLDIGSTNTITNPAPLRFSFFGTNIY